MFTADEENIVRQGGTPVSTAVLDQTDWSVYWKECATCARVKPFGQFRKDSSCREGYRDQCLECESAPRLSTAEHTHALREQNFRAAEAQRWPDQQDFKNEAARWGAPMHYGELIRKIKRITNSLYFTDGRIAGDIAVFKIHGMGVRQRDFQYLFYIPTGYMPEYSIMEFNDRDVLVREKKRGWRTVLLRLIKANVITENQANKEFGEAVGAAATQWRKQLWVHRNGQLPS